MIYATVIGAAFGAIAAIVVYGGAFGRGLVLGVAIGAFWF